MNRGDFLAAVNELLIDDWGEKHFTQRVVTKLWVMVQVISAGEFRHALEQLTLTCHKAPTLAQIRAACHPALLRARDHARSEALKVLPPCRLCDTTGWVSALSREDPTKEFSFICPCPASRVRGFTESKGATYWRHELEERFAVRETTSSSIEQTLALQKRSFAKMIAKRLASGGDREALRQQLAVLRAHRAKLVAEMGGPS